MPFFTDIELESLRIENMVLHVVGNEQFVPQPARDVQHPEFFIERVKDTDASAVFEFQVGSRTKAVIEAIARGETRFEDGAQELAREFARMHDSTTKAGAFFVFELRTGDDRTRLFSLIKYDYQQAVEQANEGDGELLRLIAQAFVTQKRAIQKSAIVRVVDGIAENALAARDRMIPGLGVAEYFGRYLHVIRTRDEEELTQTLVGVLRDLFKDLRDNLPDRDVSRAFRRSQEILRDRQNINAGAVLEAVLAAGEISNDEVVRSEVETRLTRKLKAAKLDGLEFAPSLNVMRKPPLRKVVTTEGVRLFYPDNPDDAVVRRERLMDGGERIIITTKHVTEDEIVRDSPGGAR